MSKVEILMGSYWTEIAEAGYNPLLEILVNCAVTLFHLLRRKVWLSVGTTYLPRLPTRLAAGNSFRMNSGAYAPVRSTQALSKPKKPPRMGRLFCLLPISHRSANTIQVMVKLSLVSLSNTFAMTKIDNSSECVLWATLPCSFIRSKRKKKVTAHSGPEVKVQRAQDFKALMLKHGWTQAELSRQLGVSRAWVTTVLKNAEGGNSQI